MTRDWRLLFADIGLLTTKYLLTDDVTDASTAVCHKYVTFPGEILAVPCSS